MKSRYSSFIEIGRRELRRALKRAAPIIFEDVLRFLLDDPNNFASGYAKEMMWRYIRRYSLNAEHIHTLEQAALHYLQRPMCPEFRRMCQTMAHIGTGEFWQRVESYLDDDNPIVRVNALCLYQYAQALEAGERTRLQWKKVKRQHWRQVHEETTNPYAGKFWYGKDVFEAITHPSLWQDERVVYREVKSPNLPMFWNYGYEQFAALDYRFCIPHGVIAALYHFLMDTDYARSSIDVWLSSFYIFGELGSNEVIPVMCEFYDKRIVKRFESPKRWIIMQTMYWALQRIGTPEALAASHQYLPELT